MTRTRGQLPSGFRIHNLFISALITHLLIDAKQPVARATISKMGELLDREELDLPVSSLVSIQRSGSKPPFYCVHSCEGEVLFLTSLSQHLGPEQPFYALRAQGLDGNRPLTTVEEMAAHYLKEIQAFQPQGPYIVGGADAGGMVAWEMAQQLARASKPDNVAMVVLLDTPVSKPLSSGENRDLGFIFRRILYHFRKGDVTRVLRVNAGLQYRRFQSRYRSSKGVFFIIEEAVDNYVPSAYAGCVVLFMSEKRWGYPDDPLDRINPWRNLVSGRFNYYIITGEHLQIFDEPNVPLLAKTLKMHLDEVAWGKNVG